MDLSFRRLFLVCLSWFFFFFFVTELEIYATCFIVDFVFFKVWSDFMAYQLCWLFHDKSFEDKIFKIARAHSFAHRFKYFYLTLILCNINYLFTHSEVVSSITPLKVLFTQIKGPKYRYIIPIIQFLQLNGFKYSYQVRFVLFSINQLNCFNDCSLITIQFNIIYLLAHS